MTAQATDALVDALEASEGFPVPTPRGYALRIEEQLAKRGWQIAPIPARWPGESDSDVRVPSRVQARDEPCVDPAGCDVHRAATAPNPGGGS